MGTPHRVYYIQPSLASNASVFVGREGELYTHSRGAFSIARFDNLGNAKALTSGTSSRLAPRFLFFVYLRNIILTANQGVVGLLDNKDNESSWYFVRPIFDVVCFTFICSNLKGAS